MQMPRLSVLAWKLSNEIVTDAKKMILANVYCAHCRSGVSIRKVTGGSKGRRFGSQWYICAVCGHEVARHVENLRTEFWATIVRAAEAATVVWTTGDGWGKVTQCIDFAGVPSHE